MQASAPLVSRCVRAAVNRQRSWTIWLIRMMPVWSRALPPLGLRTTAASPLRPRPRSLRAGDDEQTRSGDFRLRGAPARLSSMERLPLAASLSASNSILIEPPSSRLTDLSPDRTARGLREGCAPALEVACGFVCRDLGAELMESLAYPTLL
jgi:hypothetical protein